MRSFYEDVGLDYTPAFEAGMKAWLADPGNNSSRYGRYSYSLETFGIDPAYVRAAFAGYRARFGL